MNVKSIRTSATKKIKNMIASIKFYIMFNKQKSIIIGSIILAVLVALGVVLGCCIYNSRSSKYGYQEILDQLRLGTYTDPTTGDFIVNDAGWIVNLQPVKSAEDPIKNLAEADKDHNVQLFVGYKVNTKEKNILYTFIATAENGVKSTVYCTQNVNRKFSFEQADYSEIERIFETTIKAESEQILNSEASATEE